jgi:hypothetical protein
MADPRGNERLTAMTGAVLLVLFIAECLTLLNLGNMLTLHVFLGFLLLGPVSLKIGSTLWRLIALRRPSTLAPPSSIPRIMRAVPLHRGTPAAGAGYAAARSLWPRPQPP